MSPPHRAAQALAFVRDPGEDRLAIIHRDDTLIIVVADGAGGLSGGAHAADLLVTRIRAAVETPSLDPRSPDTWVDLLSRADLALEADHRSGETTAVVVAVSAHGVTGASAGDSGAWMISADGQIDDLTAHQHRKLRLGSGRAAPVPFSRPRLDGTLLVATDGLLNYATADRIADVARREDLDRAAQELVQLVRLPSGGLQDDIGAILVRGPSTLGS